MKFFTRPELIRFKEQLIETQGVSIKYAKGVFTKSAFGNLKAEACDHDSELIELAPKNGDFVGEPGIRVPAPVGSLSPTVLIPLRPYYLTIAIHVPDSNTNIIFAQHARQNDDAFIRGDIIHHNIDAKRWDIKGSVRLSRIGNNINEIYSALYGFRTFPGVVPLLRIVRGSVYLRDGETDIFKGCLVPNEATTLDSLQQELGMVPIRMGRVDNIGLIQRTTEARVNHYQSSVHGVEVDVIHRAADMWIFRDGSLWFDNQSFGTYHMPFDELAYFGTVLARFPRGAYQDVVFAEGLYNPMDIQNINHRVRIR